MSLGTWVTLLLALVHLGIFGLLAELVLLEHTESATQWIPLVSLTVGLLAALTVAVRPSAGALRAFRAIMAVFVAAGVLGVYLHIDGNLEFARENDPSMTGRELLMEVLGGATPALAPGALAQLGLLGLALTYRHPLLRRR